MFTVNQSAQPVTSSQMGAYNDYDCLEEMGRGRYGVVYKAKCNKSGEIVALKKVLIQDENEGFPRATLKEMKCQQNLNNDNIVKLFGICRAPRKDGSYRSQFYLIFEFCDYDLKKVLNDKRIQLTLEENKCIMVQILKGLQFLHNKNIIHRDLKPENILMTKAGQVKLADFGLSKMIDPTQTNHSNSDTNTYYVTRWYRAPELLLKDKKYGRSIDMWSVGCIFAELWTRKPILRGTDYKNQLQLISVLCGDIYWPGIRQLKSYNKFQSFLKSDPQFKESVIDYKFYIPNSLAIDLIDQLLTLNPKKRINVDDAIRSAFLESQSPSALETFFSNYPRMIESADKKRMRYEDNNQPAQKMMKFPPLDPVY